MKVLFSTYPMAFHTPGGGEVQLEAYRRHLPQIGVDVTLFDLWQPRFLEHDLVHFFSCIGGSWHFCAFVKRLGLPLVVSPNLWITPANRHDYPLDEIRRQLKLADRVVTNSDLEGDTLADVLDMPRERFCTVYNGVERSFCEPADAAPFRDRYGIDGPFLLNVANIEPRKNQLRLVEAASAFPNHRLVLIGHMRDSAYGERVLAQGGGRIAYLGPLDHDAPELRAAYAACEAFVLASTLETPGLAALEAVAQGAPAVVTNEGSCREYFGDHAVYVDPLSADAIAAGIARVLERGRRDAAAAQAMVEASYNWDRVVEALVQVYEGIARQAASTTP